MLRGLARTHGRLNANQRNYVNRQINGLSRISHRTGWQNSRLQAFVDFRNQNLFFHRCDNFFGRFGAWCAGIGLIGDLLPAFDFGGDGFVDGDADFICPGIEPYYPAFECPAVVGVDAPERCVCQLIPGSQEYDEGYAEVDEDLGPDEPPPTIVRRNVRRYVPPPADVDDVPDVPDDASEAEDAGGIEDQEIAAQKTRYLRLGNGATKKVTFYVRYHAPDEAADFEWFPGQGKSPLAINVGPGEVADIYDGPWHLHADRVFVWAETEDGQEWSAFKKKSLWLVPELNDEGDHTYQAPALDTFVFTVTPKALDTKKEVGMAR